MIGLVVLKVKGMHTKAFQSIMGAGFGLLPNEHIEATNKNVPVVWQQIPIASVYKPETIAGGAKP